MSLTKIPIATYNTAHINTYEVEHYFGLVLEAGVLHDAEDTKYYAFINYDISIRRSVRVAVPEEAEHAAPELPLPKAQTLR